MMRRARLSAKGESKRPLVRICGAFLIGILVAAGASSTALAREKKPMVEGVAECKNWCDQHNKTAASQHACYVNCEKYWGCNGSDATAQTCADVNNLAVEPDGGTKPGNPKFNPNLQRQMAPKSSNSLGP